MQLTSLIFSIPYLSGNFHARSTTTIFTNWWWKNSFVWWKIWWKLNVSLLLQIFERVINHNAVSSFWIFWLEVALFGVSILKRYLFMLICTCNFSSLISISPSTFCLIVGLSVPQYKYVTPYGKFDEKCWCIICLLVT